MLLQCENLQFGYGDKSLSEAFEFSLNEGELVALMGANGCGKSTLLKTLAGRILALGGKLLLDGSDSWSLREKALKISLMAMSMTPPQRMTVREFVSLGRTPYAGIFDGRSVEDERIIEEALALLKLESFGSRKVCELSDGEKSRVYLAQSVAQQVKVLLLDEPNAFLDIPHSHGLFRLLNQLAESRKMGMIISTHSVEYAEKYCHRIMVLDNGVIRTAPAPDARRLGLFEWTEREI